MRRATGGATLIELRIILGDTSRAGPLIGDTFIPAVPAPASLALLGIGVIGLIGRHKRR